MVERGPSGLAAEAATAPVVDPGAAIAALRAGGAGRFDPVRLCYLEALYRRAQAHRDEARRLLDERLDGALREYGERFALARKLAEEVLECVTARHPDAAGTARWLFEAGDFSGLQRYAADLARNDGQSPLAALAACIVQCSPVAAGAPAATAEAPAGAADELKAVRYFRETWSRLSVEQQLAQALAQAPENAGPLNSHLLVLRSLKLMRDLSPDYLNRFMAYVDALLWLDQADNTGTPLRKTLPAAKAL